MASAEMPEQVEALRGKAITAELVFDQASQTTLSSGSASLASQAQERLEAAGEYGMAEDVADAVDLAKRLRKVSIIWLVKLQC